MMRHPWRHAVALLLPGLIVGCAARPKALGTCTLECADASGSMCFSFYSFSKASSVDKRDDAELTFYFDSNDCANGAIFGRSDNPDYIIPLGKKSWSELERMHLLPEAEPVMGLRPIGADIVGTAFLCRIGDEQYAIVRISEVRPSSFAGISSGTPASCTFEWLIRGFKEN